MTDSNAIAPIDNLYIRTGNARIYKTMTGYGPSFGLMAKRSFQNPAYRKNIVEMIIQTNAVFKGLSNG